MSGNNREQQSKNSLPLPGGSKNPPAAEQASGDSAPPVEVKKEKSKKIQVRAIRPGFFKQERIPEGRIFEIDGEEQLGSWMELLDKEKEKVRRAQLKQKFRNNMLNLNDE